jgi:hypothetical protein
MPIQVEVPGRGLVEFPDGTSPEQMEAALAEFRVTDQEAAESPSVMSERDWVDALPAAAGTAFSLAGGTRRTPAGMALAGLGGAAGEGARQVIRSVQGRHGDVPETALGRIHEMGTAGASQAGIEGMSRGAEAIVRPAAQLVYGAALRPTIEMARDVGGGKVLSGLKRIVQQGYNDLVMPSATGRAGKLVKESQQDATRLAATKSTPTELGRLLSRATEDQGTQAVKELRAAGEPLPTEQLGERLGRIMESNPGTVSPSELLELRRATDDVAGPAYRAARIPGGVPPSPGSKASVAQSAGGVYRKRLEDILGPEFTKINKRTQARVGVREATERPKAQGLSNVAAASVGATGFGGEGGDAESAIQRFIATRALLSPHVQAATAFGLPKIARYGPRALDVASGGQLDAYTRQAIEALLAGEEPEQ